MIPGAHPDSPVSLLKSIQRLVGHPGKIFNTKDKDLTLVDPFQIPEDHQPLLLICAIYPLCILIFADPGGIVLEVRGFIGEDEDISPSLS